MGGCSSKQQAATSPERGQGTKPPVGVPRASGRLPGPQATILGCAPWCVCSACAGRGAFVGQFGPPGASRTALNGPLMRPEGSGTCSTVGPVAVSWYVIHLGNVWGPFYLCFARLYPVSGVWCPLAPNGARWPRDMHHWGSGGRILGRNPLWATCGLPVGHVLPAFLPWTVCDLDPETHKTAPKRVHNGFEKSRN